MTVEQMASTACAAYVNEGPGIGAGGEAWAWWRETVGEDCAADSVLELGVGSGLLLATALTNGASYVCGVDIASASIESAEARTQEAASDACRVDLQLLDVSHTALPWPDNTFDAVFCTETIEHVANPYFALAEAKRVLKPDGYMILVFPMPEHNLGYASGQHAHVYPGLLIRSSVDQFLLQLHFQFVRRDENGASAWYCLKNKKIPERLRDIFAVAAGNYDTPNLYAYLGGIPFKRRVKYTVARDTPDTTAADWEAVCGCSFEGYAQERGETYAVGCHSYYAESYGDYARRQAYHAGRDDLVGRTLDAGRRLLQEDYGLKLLLGYACVKPDVFRFLDHGCGTAAVGLGVAMRYPHARVVLCDYYIPARRVLFEAVQRGAFFADPTRIMWGDPDGCGIEVLASYDAVYSHYVLEHCEDPERELRHLRERMTEGGYLLLQTRIGTLEYDGSVPTAVRAFKTVEQWLEAVVRCGFSALLTDQRTYTILRTR